MPLTTFTTAAVALFCAAVATAARVTSAASDAPVCVDALSTRVDRAASAKSFAAPLSSAMSWASNASHTPTTPVSAADACASSSHTNWPSNANHAIAAARRARTPQSIDSVSRTYSASCRSPHSEPIATKALVGASLSASPVERLTHSMRPMYIPRSICVSESRPTVRCATLAGIAASRCSARGTSSAPVKPFSHGDAVHHGPDIIGSGSISCILVRCCTAVRIQEMDRAWACQNNSRDESTTFQLRLSIAMRDRVQAASAMPRQMSKQVIAVVDTP